MILGVEPEAKKQLIADAEELKRGFALGIEAILAKIVEMKPVTPPPNPPEEVK